ncbi:MAG: hypothetical protein L0Z62_24485, partial [Gemmataceae bacterium]|nr:hypothetical protein [Gemmataceae bacterium]
MLDVQLRFLQLLQRETSGTAEGSLFPAWQEGVEREVTPAANRLGELVSGPHRTDFSFLSHAEPEPIVQHPLEGFVEVSAESIGEQLFRVTVRIGNVTPLHEAATKNRDQALLGSLVSTHTVLGVRGGEFISLLDPGEPYSAQAAACHNVGTWPVLVGAAGQRDLMLSAPIILYDYPQIAPESPGDLFDGTEIEELLTLRVLTLTDQEKQEMSTVDEWVRTLLARTETVAREQLRSLHGTMRRVEPASSDQRADFQPGDRVRLRPRGRADAFDLLLTGKVATVASVEQDFENRVYFTVVLDDDPGKDFGELGQPGHRFFFRPEEVEPYEPGKEEAPVGRVHARRRNAD